jgi:hypothetical protein
MQALMRILSTSFLGGAVFLAAASADAAPPASCAKKFIGVWTHHGAGGETNIATLTADGTAACSGNAFCVQGTWTCNGNVLTYNNNMYLTDYTLQADGTMTARGGIVVTRVGRASVGPAPVPGNGIKGDTWIKAARAAQQYCTYADQMKAAEDYQRAAEAYGQSGDTAKQAWALRQQQLASNNADRCDTSKFPNKPVATNAPLQSGKLRRCQAGILEAKKLQEEGGDISNLKAVLEKEGCNVSELN